ncbi:MAG: type II toxin-antitoxin system Phd/YefM family antitoxin [Myxococcota bacterium]
MKILPAAKFKEQCLALLDDVDPEGILVTKRGKPVAKLIPVERGGKALLGSLKGKIQVKGDIFSTGIQWKADAEP